MGDVHSSSTYSIFLVNRTVTNVRLMEQAVVYILEKLLLPLTQIIATFRFVLSQILLGLTKFIRKRLEIYDINLV
jgi:hypothetical protein